MTRKEYLKLKDKKSLDIMWHSYAEVIHFIRHLINNDAYCLKLANPEDILWRIVHDLEVTQKQIREKINSCDKHPGLIEIEELEKFLKCRKSNFYQGEQDD